MIFFLVKIVFYVMFYFYLLPSYIVYVFVFIESADPLRAVERVGVLHLLILKITVLRIAVFHG